MSTFTTLPSGSPPTGLTLPQAVAEAQRCLLCHDAPCSRACPGGTDPGKFVRQIRFLNFKGAARTVLLNNPLDGVCAYVCPTADTCVKACLRTGIDRPIDIDALQRFAVDYGRHVGLRVLARGAPQKERVAIVGAGPAGLTAAARLAQNGYPVTVFEAKPKLGGMLRYGVPPSRLDDAALDADLDEIEALGVRFEVGRPVESAQKLLDQGYAAVFVAPGLWRAMALQMPGSDLDGVTTALAFLAQAREDVSGAKGLVAGHNVAVIGGGSVAMDVATTARRLGAQRIYAVALEEMTELPAQTEELEEALSIGVIIKPQCQLTEILGKAGTVSGVRGHETEWIEPGQLVPQNARPVAGTSFTLKVGAVIQAIGQGPTAAAGGMVAAATQGKLLAADEKTQKTSQERIYAGGDLVRGASTVVAAVGDGKRAARAIHSLLGGQEVAS